MSVYLGDNVLKSNFIDPQMFFQRALAISCNDNGEKQIGLKECLEHVLSPIQFLYSMIKVLQDQIIKLI